MKLDGNILVSLLRESNNVYMHTYKITSRDSTTQYVTSFRGKALVLLFLKTRNIKVTKDSIIDEDFKGILQFNEYSGDNL